MAQQTFISETKQNISLIHQTILSSRPHHHHNWSPKKQIFFISLVFCFRWETFVVFIFLDTSWGWSYAHVPMARRSCLSCLLYIVCVTIFMMMKIWSIMHDHIWRLMLSSHSLTHLLAHSSFVLYLWDERWTCGWRWRDFFYTDLDEKCGTSNITQVQARIPSSSSESSGKFLI